MDGLVGRGGFEPPTNGLKVGGHYHRSLFVDPPSLAKTRRDSPSPPRFPHVLATRQFAFVARALPVDSVWIYAEKARCAWQAINDVDIQSERHARAQVASRKLPTLDPDRRDVGPVSVTQGFWNPDELISSIGFVGKRRREHLQVIALCHGALGRISELCKLPEA